MGKTTDIEEMKEKVIFLIGFMGCGKTTFGKKAATLLGFPFFDLDDLVIQKIGMSIPSYFSNYGETAFREREKETLHELSRMASGVVATGGGTPCHDNNMEWMNKKGITVYLKMSEQALFSRLTQKERKSRPLIKDKDDSELLAFIHSKLREREPFYQQATITLDAIQNKPESLVQRLLNKS